ncbi:hypothetical protein QJS10_CPA05g01707 [Acorus calamus]|uniref:Transposase MuDR plant domain-containing protein n=1 Tax=Acorus calamus TaxID=4465 RepID=A0AAV9EWR4_ACOCL|nr:hypothetical protein QJS10_CPA05g01707 [Acorus calamus]
MRSSRRRSVRSVEGVLVPRTSAFVNLVGETTNAGISNRQRASTSLESIQEDTYTNIIFRYGGFWKMVKGSDRRSYRLGRQKTIRLDKDYCNMDEIFEEVGKLVKLGENDALNMQFKIPGREEYDTLANEHDMIAMFNMHQGSPNIEIFITIEHDVHPTPDDMGFQSDEMFGVESHNDGFVDPMEALSSFLDREGNGVDYAIFYDSEEEQYTVVDYLNQNKRRHSVSIEELDDDDAPFIPPTTVHEVPISPAVTSDQPREPVHVEAMCEEPVHDPSDIEADRICSESSYHEICSSDNHVSDYEGIFDQLDEEDPNINVGVKFENIHALRHALRQHAVKNEFCLRLIRSEPSRLTARCETESCPWRIHASVLPDHVTFHIKTLKAAHTCSSMNKRGNNMATYE